MAEEERPAEILDHVGYVRRLQDEGDPEQWQRAPVPRIDADQDVGQTHDQAEAVRDQALIQAGDVVVKMNCHSKLQLELAGGKIILGINKTDQHDKYHDWILHVCFQTG